MKKLPTLFERIYDNHKIVGIIDHITPGCEEAFKNGIATVKFDGACCAIINGEFYKRYECKKGKTPPEGAIACCDTDPITGHWPHWVKVDESNPADKWFYEAYIRSGSILLSDGTYEAVGPHFQGNPYELYFEELVKHGDLMINVGRDFDSIKEYLKNHKIEGLVFWLNGEPVCKIKRSDFGFAWPCNKGEKK